MEPWEFELAGTDPHRKGLDDSNDVQLGLPFSAADTQTAAFPWTWDITADLWRSYLATHSAVAAMDEAARVERLDASAAIVAKACDQTGSATAQTAHEALCVRWQPQ